jgi:hypothetical protein
MRYRIEGLYGTHMSPPYTLAAMKTLFLYPQSAARSLRRRSFLGLLGAAALTAAAVPATRAMGGTGSGGAGIGVGRDQCGPPPADLLPGGAYDRRLTAMAASDQFSGTVLLAYQGRPVLTRAVGWADKERSIPNQTGTLFNLQSVTKVFTGLAVAQLAAMPASCARPPTTLEAATRAGGRGAHRRGQAAGHRVERATGEQSKRLRPRP